MKRTSLFCWTHGPPGVWPVGSGLVPIRGDDALSALVLPHTYSSIGVGRHGSDVVRLSMYAFPPIALLLFLRGFTRTGFICYSSPILANLSMVVGPDVSPVRLFVGDYCQKGSSPRQGAHLAGEMEKLWVWPLRETNSCTLVSQLRSLRFKWLPLLLTMHLWVVNHWRDILLSCFLLGAMQLKPASHVRVAIVLEELSMTSFEPFESFFSSIQFPRKGTLWLQL